MAIKRVFGFSLQCVGDGSSSTMNIVLGDASVFFTHPPEMGTGNVLSPTLNLATLKPSDVLNVSCPTAGIPAVTSASITTLGTILQVVFATAPANNAVFTVAGTFVF